jgi:predicted PurR-regulated permease PerM
MVNKKQIYKTSVAVNFAAFIIIIAGLMYGASIVSQLLMALFISIICAQPIMWLQKKKVPQSLSVAIVFIAIIALFIGFGELISNSLSSFSDNTSQYEQNLNAMGASIVEFLKTRGIDISSDKIAGMFAPSKIMGLTAGILSQLGGFMGNTLTIFFLVIFLLLELDSISLKSKAIMMNSTASIEYLTTIGKSIRHYLSIKTLTSLLTGVLVWICLEIIGLDYAIIWGLIAFLLNYIPNIGSIIAAVPAVLFAVVQMGFGGAIWTTGIFIAINMTIGNAVEPKMMGQGLGLSTFVVFLSLIFWGFILGTVGMFLSVPLTMAIKIMLEQNPNTRWIAIILGTEKDARALLDEEKPAVDNL